MLTTGLCCIMALPIVAPPDPAVSDADPAELPAPVDAPPVAPIRIANFPRLSEVETRAPDDDRAPLRDAPRAGGGVVDHLRSIPWEAGGVAAGITALGIFNWNWGSSGFHFSSEGWFGRDTSSFGSDKLGHAYSTYVMTEFLSAAIRRNARAPKRAQVSAAAISMALMTYVEVFDGFSGDHGFAWEDMAANTAGAAFSVLRHTVPGLNDKLDFRLHYIPSGNVGWRPITDYSGQRYVLAVKLAGFEPFADGPSRFVELHGGYYARGFTEREKLRGVEPKRALFVGIGFNLQQLISRDRGEKSRFHRAARSALEYVQVPYTAAYSR
ncbi:DUF2279 domain-containing protein [Sphingomonas sp. ST-64]|uniref:DUF2279 domain-containing protein n=1 Tax=Sphingomonas plantiphila TaxID=3163295 RepID=A0ABW8YMK3_9SPHN